MAELGRAALKAFFEAGDTPTESQFSDLIDSLVNIVDDDFCEWNKVTINFDDFQPEVGKTKFIDAFNVPAGYQVHRLIIHPTIAFTGAPITNATVELYEETDTAAYHSTTVVVFTAPTDKSGKVSPGYITASNYLIDFTTGNNVRIKLVIIGALAEINDLTQGSLDIYYKLDKLP